MAIPTFDHDDAAEGIAAEAPTVLDLTAGPARITPVWHAEEGRQYSIELPEGPLTPADAGSLATGLHRAQPGAAVLVDIEDYAEPQ